MILNSKQKIKHRLIMTRNSGHSTSLSIRYLMLLNITPPGAQSASYVDLDKMTPQMAVWAHQAQPVLNEVDTIYKSNTTRMYYSDLKFGKNSSFLLLSTMDPMKNDSNTYSLIHIMITLCL